MPFFNRFPYTNFHELNLDWILKKINEIAGMEIIRTVNNKSADSTGNVELTINDIPNAIKTVNNIDPDSNGNVNVGTVKKVNNTSPDSNGNVDVGTVKYVNGLPADDSGSVILQATNISGVVRYVNNVAPDSTYGNVNVGTVKSVNNTHPDNNGNVNLPSVSGVTSVNGIGADGTGNVQLDAIDVDAVASVNGIFPDNTGDVELTARLIGAVASVNNVQPVNGEVTLTKAVIDSILGNLNYTTDGINTNKITIQSGGYVEIGNIVIIAIRVETTTAINKGEFLCGGFPAPISSVSSTSSVGAFSHNKIGKAFLLTGSGGVLLSGDSDANLASGTLITLSLIYLKS